MARSKPVVTRVVDSMRLALDRESNKRQDGLKPIEIVKVAVCSYQSYYACEKSGDTEIESDDRAGLRRGMQSSVDRLLFNVNYWLSAYEDNIVAACDDAETARLLLRKIAAWNSHTMKLNTLSSSEAVTVFERFCPPFALNNRRGKSNRAGSGKGPVQDFKKCVAETSGLSEAESQRLKEIVEEIDSEVALYEQLSSLSSLDAFFELLPAWCLQDRIELVRGQWWNDADAMSLLSERIYNRFVELGYAQPLCSYYRDVMRESIDNYTRTIDTEESSYRYTPIAQVISLIRNARSANPNFEIEGYGEGLPAWLDSKEQLIWNTVVCALYGPMYARPLLADNLESLPVEGQPANIDIITELAQRAYRRYLATRSKSGIEPKFVSFHEQPHDLKVSGLERIESIPGMLGVLGYRIVPLASCYPEQRVRSFKQSEIECLAILEHRRWFAERTAAKWKYAPRKDVEAKQSPYLVDWDDLPDYAREWNRETVRDIPELLESVGLAVSM